MIQQGGLAPGQLPCPFCGAAVDGGRCTTCRRDPSARRRPCAACGKMTPVGEGACCHCRVEQKSGKVGKVLLIIAIVVVLNAIGIAIRIAAG